MSSWAGWRRPAEMTVVRGRTHTKPRRHQVFCDSLVFFAPSREPSDIWSEARIDLERLLPQTGAEEVGMLLSKVERFHACYAALLRVSLRRLLGSIAQHACVA